MILFTGLTGAIGGEIVRLLPDFGLRARALVRDPEKAGALEAAGIDVIRGDLGDPATLRDALQGCEQAFLLAANVQRQLELEKGFVDAARQAGLRHLVKMSANGADSNSPAILKRYHGDAERYIRESGLPYTLVRPNFFMQNMLFPATTIREQDCFFMPMGEGRVGIIDGRDVARFILTVLTQPGHENRMYEITGSERVSFRDIADRLSAALGREIRYVDISPDAFRQAFLQRTPDVWHVDAVCGLFELIARNEGDLINDTYARVTGREPATLRRFFEEHASLFGKEGAAGKERAS